MDLNAIITAFGAHNWLVLVMIGALYVRTLFSNKSRFPWTWAPNWLPIFSGLAGAVITVDASMIKGATFVASLPFGFLGLVSGGFFDGLLVAIFGSPANAPTWTKFIVGIIDDLTGGAAAKRGFVRLRLLGGLAIGGLLLVLVAAPRPASHVQRATVVQAEGCSWFAANKQAVVGDIGQIGSCILSQLFQGQSDPLKIAAACAPATLADVDQIIVSLLNYYTAQDGGPPPPAPAGLVDRLVATHESARAAMKGAK